MVDGFNGSPSIFKAYPAWANTAQAELVAAQFTACLFSSSGSLAMLAAMRRTKRLNGTSVPFGLHFCYGRTEGHVVASRSPGRRP